jgi:hypothetical protein
VTLAVRLTLRREVGLRSFTWLRHNGATALLLMTAIASCTHNSRRSPSRQAGPVSDASVIRRAEIDSLTAQYQNAYDLIRMARPNMLTSRDIRFPYPVREGVVSDPSGVKVFMDDVHLGGIDMLRRIPSRSIIFIQRLSPSDATTRFGSGMVAGVIAITTGTTR